MNYNKLETLNESWAFYEAYKAFPVRSVEINNGEIYQIQFDYDEYESWLEDYREDGSSDSVTNNKEEWLFRYADVPIDGYANSAKRLWQTSARVQGCVYAIARRHSYCRCPASKSWAHPNEVAA